MPFKKGYIPPNAGKGRVAGQKNKFTRELKEMILGALDKAGGEDYLLARANDPKTQAAFLSLIGKVLPTTLAGDRNAPLTMEVSLRPQLTPEQWMAAHGIG